MKSTMLPLFFALALLSCSHDGKITHTQKNDDGTVTTTSMNLNAMANNADDVNEKVEELKN